jgi:hypothetical protein
MEYAGYVSPEKSTDWSALTGQLAGKLDSIGKDRTAQKEALDAKAQDAEAYINSIEATQNQNATQLLNDFGYTGKGKLLKWNKDLKAGILSPKDYNNNIATLNDYTSTFANSLKTFDQRYQEVLRRQQSGEASAYELELANRFGQVANLQNAKIQVSDSGRVYMSKVDPNTGEIIDDLIDVRTINLPENIVANKINVAEQTSKLMEGWSPDSVWKDLGTGGEKTIESLRLNDAYNLMKANLAETVASDDNPRAQISVLVDNGVINADYYINDAEYKQKMADAIARAKKIKQTAGMSTELSKQEMEDIELSMVKLEKDASGIINPVPSEAQKKAAKERVMQEVDMNAGEKITGQAKQDWYHAPTNNNNNGNGDMTNDNYLNGYLAVRQAWNKADYSMLSKDYQYVPEGNGVTSVYKTTVTTDSKGNEKTTKQFVKKISNPEGFAEFAFDTKNANDAITFYKSGKNIFDNNGMANDPKYKVNGSGGGSTKNEIKASDIPAKAKAAGYSEAEYKKLLKQRGIKII